MKICTRPTFCERPYRFGYCSQICHKSASCKSARCELVISVQIPTHRFDRLLHLTPCRFVFVGTPYSKGRRSYPGLRWLSSRDHNSSSGLNHVKVKGWMWSDARLRDHTPWGLVKRMPFHGVTGSDDPADSFCWSFNGVTGIVTHTPGLVGAWQINKDIDKMARSAHNFVDIFQRCLGNFKEAPILIPPCILAREKKWAYLTILVVANHSSAACTIGLVVKTNWLDSNREGPGYESRCRAQ